MRYRVHRFDLRMSADSQRLEQFLNGLEGDVIAVIPNVTMGFLWIHRVDFVLVVEGLAHRDGPHRRSYGPAPWG